MSIAKRVSKVKKKVKKKVSKAKKKASKVKEKVVKAKGKVASTKQKIDARIIDQGLHKNIKVGYYFGTSSKLDKTMLKTSITMLEHYISVWEGHSDTRKSLQDLDDGFTFWGNEKSKSKQSFASERKIIKGKMIQTRKSQARAIVATNSEAIVVSFRGSGVQKDPEQRFKRVNKIIGTVKNGVADARILLREKAGFPGRVHTGFHEEYTNINKVIIEAIKNCENYRNKKIYVTGFSLGAAMAALCLCELNSKKGTLKLNKGIYGYLFATPSPGDKVFNSEFKKLKNIITFAHEKDPVPQLLHGTFKNYEAPGNKMFVISTGASTSKKRCHKKAEHTNIDKIKLSVNPKRFLVLRKLRPHSMNTALIIKNFLKPFGSIHNGPVYQRCLIEILTNFETKVDKKSTLSKAAKKYNKEGADQAVWSDYLKM